MALVYFATSAAVATRDLKARLNYCEYQQISAKDEAARRTTDVLLAIAAKDEEKARKMCVAHKENRFDATMLAPGYLRLVFTSSSPHVLLSPTCSEELFDFLQQPSQGCYDGGNVYFGNCFGSSAWTSVVDFLYTGVLRAEKTVEVWDQLKAIALIYSITSLEQALEDIDNWSEPAFPKPRRDCIIFERYPSEKEAFGASVHKTAESQRRDLLSSRPVMLRDATDRISRPPRMLEEEKRLPPKKRRLKSQGSGESDARESANRPIAPNGMEENAAENLPRLAPLPTAGQSNPAFRGVLAPLTVNQAAPNLPNPTETMQTAQGTSKARRKSSAPLRPPESSQGTSKARRKSSAPLQPPKSRIQLPTTSTGKRHTSNIVIHPGLPEDPIVDVHYRKERDGKYWCLIDNEGKPCNDGDPFSDWTAFKVRHYLSHRGVRPYWCFLCGQRFLQNYNVNKIGHMRKHLRAGTVIPSYVLKALDILERDDKKARRKTTTLLEELRAEAEKFRVRFDEPDEKVEPQVHMWDASEPLYGQTDQKMRDRLERLGIKVRELPEEYIGSQRDGKKGEADGAGGNG